MAFSNPILGNEVLVRTAMQSEGFNVGTEGQVNGWRFERDGSAYLTDVTVGNTNYTIDENGNASFNDVNVAGEFNYQGDDFPVILARFPKGMIAWGALNTIVGTNVNSSTEVAFLEVDAILEHGRMYKIAISPLALTCVLGTGGTFPWVGTIRIRDGGTSSPTTSSNLLVRAAIEIDNNASSGGAAAHSAAIDLVFSCNDNEATSISNLHSGVHRFAVTLSLSFGSLGTTISNRGINITTANGTINPVTLYIEDKGPLLANTGQALTGSGGGTGTDPTDTVIKTYNSVWSRSWDSGFNVRHTNGQISQGYYSSSDGNQRSWVGFDFAQIQSDLTGATVVKVEFYLYYDHWYNNAGGTAIIGTISSTATSAPTYNAGQDNQDRKRVSGWQRNQGKWVDMTSVVGSEFQTGTSTGVCIGIGPSTSQSYYGLARGNTETNEPKIRITYTT
jgi:hypothetical protein